MTNSSNSYAHLPVIFKNARLEQVHFLFLAPPLLERSADLGRLLGPLLRVLLLFASAFSFSYWLRWLLPLALAERKANDRS